MARPRLSGHNNIYAEIDPEVKAKALAKCELTDAGHANRRWPELMAFLRAL